MNNYIYQSCFEEIYKRYYNLLVIYASSIIGRNEGHDMVQDVFMNLLEKKRIIILESSLLVYLYRAVKNKCMDFLRHQKVKCKYDFTVRSELQQNKSGNFCYTSNEIEGNLLFDEIREEIKYVCENLSQKGKEALILHFVQKKTLKEIFHTLEISRRAAEKEISGCITTLRNKFAKFGLSGETILRIIEEILFHDDNERNSVT